MKSLNLLRLARVWPLAAVPVLLMVACQKYNNPASTTTDAALAKSQILIHLPPPIILAWQRLADLPFPDGVSGDVPDALVSPLGFAIAAKGYLCGGRTSTSFGQAEELKNLWEYDTVTKAWTQKASFPGAITPDDGADFVIGKNAYVIVNSANWRYNQPTNTWTPRASMPGHPRGHGTGFTIKNKGYVGLGFDLTTATGDLKDFYEYEPGMDTWVKKANLPGDKREGAMGFVIGDNGYVTSGMHVVSGSPTVYLTDTWQYHAATDTWTSKAAFPASGRAHGIGLSGLNIGYAGTGSDNTKFYGDFYAYTQSTNSWSTLPSGPPARDQAGSFFIANNIYVAGGTAGLDGMKDFWTLHF